MPKEMSNYSENIENPILSSDYLEKVRSQARLGDEGQGDKFRLAKYGGALHMLVHEWRRVWPDCLLKISKFGKTDHAYLVEILVELPPYSYPGGQCDGFRAAFLFENSDDLIIDFCLSAKEVTDQFYSWQQSMLRKSIQVK